MRMKPLRLLIVGCVVAFASVVCAPALATFGPNAPDEDGINAVLGDASWVAVHGEAPGEDAAEVARIRTHLRYVVDRLESADTSELSDSQRSRRARALSGLREYAEAGVFPRRDAGDGYGPRRPRFIDDRGVHCAVGEMIRRSGRSQLARTIRERWEYAYVPDIESKALVSWAVEHGFRTRELAMIQPAYGAPPSPESVKRRIAKAKDAVTMLCARRHETPDTVTLKIRGDSRATLTATVSDEAGAFARCFRKRLAMSYLQGGGALDTEPTAFELSLTVDIVPPGELLERRLEKMSLGGPSSNCVPRPGPIPQHADIRVQSNQKGTDVVVNTEPENEEVEQCLTEKVELNIRRWKHGGKWDVDLRARKKIQPTLTDERLDIPATSAAIDCFETSGAAKYRVKVVANPNTQRFEVDVVGNDGKLQACFAKAYDRQARSNFSVPRKLEDGKYERYFRIDAKAKTSFKVRVNEADKSLCLDGGVSASIGKGTRSQCEGRMTKPPIRPEF